MSCLHRYRASFLVRDFLFFLPFEMSGCSGITVAEWIGILIWLAICCAVLKVPFQQTGHSRKKKAGGPWRESLDVCKATLHCCNNAVKM